MIPFDDIIKYRNELRRSSFALCWNESEHESVGLWERYTNECNGVAIRSSVSKLSTIGANHEGPFYVGRVGYVNFRHKEPIPNIMSSLFYPLLLKDYSYTEENEIRVLHCDWRRLEEASKMQIQEHDLPIINGIEIEIEPSEIILECRVRPDSPQWYFDLIKKMTASLGYSSINVSKSEMDIY